jgi:glutaredoxin
MTKNPLVPLAAALLVASAPALAQQSVYKWVDKDGKVQFSDMPPTEAKDVTEKRMGGGYVDQEYPYAVQQAMKKNPVTLYTAASCGEPCDQARELLGSRGVPFAQKDPQKDKDAGDALKALIGGLEVPVMVVGENKVKGFEPEQWNSALDSAGYPRTRLPGAPSR